MSDRRPDLVAGPATAAGWRDSPLVTAAWTGCTAAGLGALATIAVALLLWIPDVDATATSSGIVHAGLITFLLAMHGGARINGVQIGFVPLGMTLAAAGSCWRFGRPLWGHPLRAGRRATTLVATQVAGFLATCAVLIPFARLGTSSIGWAGPLAGAGVVAIVGFGGCALRQSAEGLRHLPAAAVVAARAAAAAGAVYLAGGAVLAGAATAREHDRFLQLSRALTHGGGGLPIAAIQFGTAPNAALAGAGYLAGPGFRIGAAHYALRGSSTADVPAFPILAGLPASSAPAGNVALALAALTMLVAGLVVGLLIARSARLTRLREEVLATVLAGVGTGTLLGVATGLAGGRLGAHALRAVGAPAVLVGLCVAGEVTAVALVTDLLVALYRILRHRARTVEPADRSADGDGDEAAERAVVDLVPATVATGRPRVVVVPTAATHTGADDPLDDNGGTADGTDVPARAAS